MKAIFAVTALAAAISGQALAADTESTTTYTGGVVVEYIHTLANEDGSDPTPASAFGENGDDTNLSASVAVANGPFSGTISFSDDDEVEVDDLKVDNGTFAFGDIGGIITTEGTVEGMESHAWASDSAFRYTNADLGLQVQIAEGTTEITGDADLNGDGDFLDEVDVCSADVVAIDPNNGNSYTTLGECDEDEEEWDQVLESLETAGLDVAYTTDLDVATVTADLQYRVTHPALLGDFTGTGNKAAAMYYGVKVVSSPIDMLTLTAGYNSGHGVMADADESVASYGVRADVAVMEGVTAYGSYAATDIADSDATIQAGAAATFGPATVTADYEVEGDTDLGVSVTSAMDALTLSASVDYSMPTVGDATYEAMASVAYAVSDATSASAQATSDNGEFMEIIATLTHTLEDGIVLAAEYETDNHEDSGNDKDGSNFKNEVKLSASYSF